MTVKAYELLRLSAEGFKNPRMHTDMFTVDLIDLAVHIGLHGILNPPLVLEDGLIIAGSRRYRAIGILLAWFRTDDCKCADVERLIGHAELCMIGQRSKALADLSDDEVNQVRRRAESFSLWGVPVRVLSTAMKDRAGIALADNLQRVDLSSYEIASYLDHMESEGSTQADLARVIGKSKTYVSRKISAWRGAGPVLREMWRGGHVTDERVQELAQLPHDDQAKELAGPTPRGRRGPANRPGIDTVKEVLSKIDDKDRPIKYAAADTGSYTAGVIDALRWINGDNTSGAFAKLMEVVDGEAR